MPKHCEEQVSNFFASIKGNSKSKQKEVLILSVSDINLMQHDLGKLRPGRMLNDAVIDAYIRLLSPTKMDDVFILESLVYTKLREIILNRSLAVHQLVGSLHLWVIGCCVVGAKR